MKFSKIRDYIKSQGVNNITKIKPTNLGISNEVYEISTDKNRFYFRILKEYKSARVEAKLHKILIDLK